MDWKLSRGFQLLPNFKLQLQLNDRQIRFLGVSAIALGFSLFYIHIFNKKKSIGFRGKRRPRRRTSLGDRGGGYEDENENHCDKLVEYADLDYREVDSQGFKVRRTGAMRGEHDPLVGGYSHLSEFPRANEALHTLKKIASLVKPIMRARSWRVGELAEFWPDQQNLLGLNVNKGQKILVRLRYPGDKTQFLPIEQVVDTMLHELAHIVHGPHNEQFHALWDQLRDEHEGLVRKGYTGEGFLSEGRRLGGSSGRSRIPMHEARRLARAAAERRNALSAGSGQRLGGNAPRPGQDIRNVIVNAIERRNKALKGCGNTNHNEREIREISDQASRNGFRTQAEEEAANEAAIAQALWELVQEDEKEKLGSSYVPPSAHNPTGYLDVDAGEYRDGGSSSKAAAESSRPSSSSVKPSPSVPVATRPKDSEDSEPVTWTCHICTLVNKADFLCCEACETERSTEVSMELAKKIDNKRRRTREVVDLTGSSPVRKSTKQKNPSSGGGGGGGSSSRSSTATSTPASSTWTCSFCGRVMDNQWWTCATCARMKDSS